MALRTVLVVGGSLAGLRTIEALRRRGYDGRLVWVGAEAHLPYDRPPLSKQLLDGTWERDRVFFRRREGWEALACEQRFGRRATRLALDTRHVELDDGSSVGFDGLVIATGARARTIALPRTGVHTLRTLDDAEAIRAAMEGAPRVVIVGAGFIGLEVASSCRARGLSVTVVEPQATVLAGPLGAAPGKMIERWHRDAGVDFVFGRRVQRLQGEPRVEGVWLDDGAFLPADLVVVGVGVVPETEWLEGSGLSVDDGVICDARGITSAHDVCAAGDVARWQSPLYGDSRRVEHWTSAVEQGNRVAETLLDGPASGTPFASVPYFWSDQHGVKLQFVGRRFPEDAVHVAEDDAVARRGAILFARSGKLTAALVWNRPAVLMKYRKLLADGGTLETALQLGRSG